MPSYALWDEGYGVAFSSKGEINKDVPEFLGIMFIYVITEGLEWMIKPEKLA
jgi:hypothetical protein